VTSVTDLRHTLLCFAMPLIYMTGVQAQDSPNPLGELHNCQELDIPELDEFMTRQEKVEILDALLSDILNRTGGCERLASSAGVSGSGSSGSGSDTQLRGASQSGAPSTGIMEGREAEESLAGLETEQAGIDPESRENPSLSESKPTSWEVPPGSGKIPEDIPSADSDDVIAKQIRKAAIAETDPEKQAKLWDRYRQYKNLSQKPESQAL